MKTIAVILFAAFAMQANAAEKLFDDNLATNAVAVVRVHMLSSIQIPKYPVTRYDVHVYQVFKNESRENLYHDFGVFAFTGKDGVPPGECTIYIARYNLQKMAFEDTNGSIWMLIGGDATKGVSHVDRKAVLRPGSVTDTNSSPSEKWQSAALWPVGSFHFDDSQKIDVQGILQIYKAMSELELVIDSRAAQIHTPIVSHAKLTDSFTTVEALKLMEKNLLEEAGIVIIHLDDKRVSVTYNDALPIKK
jgi:hypothetical protein